MFLLPIHKIQMSPRKSPSRDSGNQESEDTPKGLFYFEPNHIVFDADDVE